MESISIFDNFDFITKYEEKFEEYIKGEFKLKIEEIKEKNSKEKKLIKMFNYIYDYYTKQLEFFEKLSSLDNFFEKYKMRFKELFKNIVKFELIDIIDYKMEYNNYMEVIFEKWKKCIHKNFTNSQLGISHNNERYEFIKNMLKEEQESEEEGLAHFGNSSLFDFSELKQFICFHEIFGLTSSHLKPFYLNFMVDKLSGLIDFLISETFEGEDIIDDVFMPYVNTFSIAYIQTLGDKIDQIRSVVFQENINLMCEIRHHKEKFGLKFMESLAKDMNYIYVRKVGTKILDLVLDMPNTVERVKEVTEYVEKVNMNQEVCQWLREALVSRLLSPGVTTHNILSSYFNIVATLKIIDPNMMNFSYVIAPVKAFLLKRSDLIRCIISFWKEERERE